MAEKKKTSTPPKSRIEKAPSLRDRITDFSTGAYVGKAIYTPKRGKKK